MRAKNNDWWVFYKYSTANRFIMFVFFFARYAIIGDANLEK